MPFFLKERRQVLDLPIHDIAPNPNQPRTLFQEEDLKELSHSIAQLGVLQPLSVRKVNGTWELIAGERRLRAADMAGLTTVPCIVVSANEETSSLLALVENLQRRDLDVWEEAYALRRLIDQYHLSQEEVARRVGKSQSAVANKLRLLKLPEKVIDMLRTANLSERHARALLRLDREEAQAEAAQYIIRHQLTVAQSEQYIARMATQPKGKKSATPILRTRDVRLFFNSLRRSMAMMKSAGVNAQLSRQETDNEVLVTIHIPKDQPKSK